MSEIKQLKKDDFQQFIELFFRCFENDNFYEKRFENCCNKIEEMRRCFTPSLEFCFEEGEAFGFFEDNKLIAFMLLFDYGYVRRNFPSKFCKIFGAYDEQNLPFKQEIHDKIDCNTIYLLSLGVDNKFRNKGLATKLVRFAVNRYPWHHIVGDVSNKDSLGIYTKLDFNIKEIRENYYLVYRKIKLALPDNSIQQLIPNFLGDCKEVEIKGYRKSLDSKRSSFIKEPSAQSIRAFVYDVSYRELLEYQRIINLSHYDENTYSTEIGQIVIYSEIKNHENNPLLNGTLSDMIESRQTEWEVIPDLYVMFPVEIDHKSVVLDKYLRDTVCRNNWIDTFLKLLDFRTSYESGVIKSTENMGDTLDFKKRIKRTYLGKIKVKVTQEPKFNQGSLDIGQPAYVDLIASFDQDGEGNTSGVVSIVSLSTPFLLSHVLDNIIRNQLLVFCDDEWINFFDYLSEKLSIYKRGSPKMCLTIPRSKDCLNRNQLASLLMSETIYGVGENLGSFIDSEVTDIVDSKYGMGQYDRGVVYASTNVFLHFIETLQTSICGRVNEEVISYLYVELLMLEESSVQIANNSIVMLLSKENKMPPTKFLETTCDIQKKYTKTMVFWDIQMNYPSSKKSVDMLRKAFRIEKQIERFKRNQGELQILFESRMEIMDRVESVILNYVILFLTLVQGLSIVVPALFSEHLSFSLPKLDGIGVITAIIAVYWIVKKITWRYLFYKRKNRFR